MKIHAHNCIFRKKNAGSGLLIAVMVLFLMSAIVMGSMLLTTNTLYSNNRQIARMKAFVIAESGAEKAANWLREQSYPPTGTTAFYPFGAQSITLGDGGYSVIIYPDTDNNLKYLKAYRIVSTGTVSNVSKKVEIYIRQSSFGKYAYFTHKETSVSGGEIWWKAGEVIDGPAHSNNADSSNFKINYNNSNSPIFLDMLTSSGNTITYKPSRPKNESAFRKVFANGSKGYKLGVGEILLPPTTDAQRDAAWGSSANFPSTNGVYLRSDVSGGVYIKGDAAITLSVNAQGKQVVTVTQGANTSILTIDNATSTVTTSGAMGTGSAPSGTVAPNGVIYCTGNITSLSGVVADNYVQNEEIVNRSALTIATDVVNGKDITITNNLTYRTKPDKTADADAAANLAAGTLGLVAQDITIASTAPANLEIDAVCLAGGKDTDGSFGVANYGSKKPAGTLTVLGGIIQKERGAVGTFDPNTNSTLTGYAKNYHYDPRLAQSPPPFYPTTGQYERLSWRVLPD